MTDPFLGNSLVPELSVTSWAKSRRFYCDVLGFSVQYERPDEGFSFLCRNDAQLMIDQVDLGRTFGGAHLPTAYPFGKGINLQIRVENVQSILDSVNANKCPLVLPLEDKWYQAGDYKVGNRQFVVADPDGYLLRLFQDLGTLPS